MEFRFKDIHIGSVIYLVVQEKNIDNTHIISYFNVDDWQIEQMYTKRSLDTETVLKWSKLLEYDFFRIYSQHLLLYAPFHKIDEPTAENYINTTPVFKKNLYTPEIIQFIVELVQTNQKTPSEVIEYYRIPRSTLYKWIGKHRKNK